MTNMSARTGQTLRVVDLTKRYGPTTAIDHLNLEIPPGVIYGLLGPNGAGKTTTLEIIEGLRKPDGGRVLYGEMDLVRNKSEAKLRFGVQLQTSAFFDLLTVEETLDLFRSFYPHPAPTATLVTRLGLSEKAGARVEGLSGGQRQRLALAVALVNDPEVVFLDEPSAGLDPQARRNLWDIIRALRDEGRTVVLTTHYMEEAEFLCDRLAIVDHGKVLDEGSPLALIQKHLPGAVIELSRETDIPSDLSLPHLVRIEREPEATALVTSNLEATLVALVTWSQEFGRPLTGLRTRSATLEDVFLHLTGRSLRE